MRIKAAVARDHDRPLDIAGLDLDEPRADEIAVRVVACGVSTRDLAALRGDFAIPLPFVPGAEGAGIVEHVGHDVADLASGDAVILTSAACGVCPPCLGGHRLACEAFAPLNVSGRRRDGSSPFSDGGRPVAGFFMGQSALATHIVCPASCAVRLPAGAPLEVLASLGGPMLESACAVLDTFAIGAGDSLVVAGAGPAGLVAVMLAKAHGATLIAVADADEGRRSLATELGATVAVHTFGDLATVVRSMVADGARYALDTTGGADGRTACRESLGLGGLCASLESSAEERRADDFAMAGATLDPSSLITTMAAMYGEGRLPIDRLVSFFPFEAVNDAFRALLENRVIQPIVRFPLGAFDDLDRARMEGAASEVPDEPAPEDVVEDEALPTNDPETVPAPPI